MRRLSGYRKIGRDLSRVVTIPDISIREKSEKVTIYLLDSEGFKLKDSEGYYLTVNG